jgi:hypothetical protein
VQARPAAPERRAEGHRRYRGGSTRVS